MTKETNWALFLTLCLLQLFDVIMTAFVLQSGGIEWNPILKCCSLTQIAFIKFGLLAVIGMTLYLVQESKVATGMLAFANMFYAMILIPIVIGG